MESGGGAVSEGTMPNVDSGEKIEAKALQVKFEIMKQAEVSSLRVKLECMWKRFASLLDSRSMVSPVQQSYFGQNIKTQLGPARWPEANPHNLFDLKGGKQGNIPIMRYFVMDVAFLGLSMPNLGSLW